MSELHAQRWTQHFRPLQRLRCFGLSAANCSRSFEGLQDLYRPRFMISAFRNSDSRPSGLMLHALRGRGQGPITKAFAKSNRTKAFQSTVQPVQDDAPNKSQATRCLRYLLSVGCMLGPHPLIRYSENKGSLLGDFFLDSSTAVVTYCKNIVLQPHVENLGFTARIRFRYVWALSPVSSQTK